MRPRLCRAVKGYSMLRGWAPPQQLQPAQLFPADKAPALVPGLAFLWSRSTVRQCISNGALVAKAGRVMRPTLWRGAIWVNLLRGGAEGAARGDRQPPVGFDRAGKAGNEFGLGDAEDFEQQRAVA